MAYPVSYTAQVAIPLPSDDEVRRIIGASYDQATTLNVVKMMAGTDDMCEATLGLVQAVFEAKGIDPRTREIIILRAAKALNAPYEWQANAALASGPNILREKTRRRRALDLPDWPEPSHLGTPRHRMQTAKFRWTTTILP